MISAFIKMGSDVSHMNDSLFIIVRGKVRRVSINHNIIFEERCEPPWPGGKALGW